MSSFHIHSVEQALLSKGFMRVPGDHRRFYYLVEGRKSRVRTRFSHSDRRIEGIRVRQMAKEIGLDRAEFEAFVNCPLSGEIYLSLVRGRGLL